MTLSMLIFVQSGPILYKCFVASFSGRSHLKAFPTAYIQQRYYSSSHSDDFKVKTVLVPLETDDKTPKTPDGVSFVKKFVQKSLLPKKETNDTFNIEKVEEILKGLEEEYNFEDDRPVPDMVDPYKEPPKRCVICQYNVKIDYKNVQLLSQFVSPYTGRIYGRHVTGLCIPMQKEVSRLIKRARDFGFMPYTYKLSEYHEDPKLFDPFRPNK